MPIGIITNALVVAVGGIVGALAGYKISESFKENLNTVFGACAMAMGISSVVLMENMPAVVFRSSWELRSGWPCIWDSGSTGPG